MISDVRFFFDKLNMKQTERAALSFGHVVHQDDVHASTSSHSTASLRSLPGGVTVAIYSCWVVPQFVGEVDL